MSCQNRLNCNFFVYLEEEKVCKLQITNFANRVCDIVHGPPDPAVQDCLDENKILWANSSGTIYKYNLNNIHNGIYFYIYIYI